MRTQDLILSLTSSPARMPGVAACVRSLLDQSIRPERTILWLTPEEFPAREEALPRELLPLRDHGLEIRWTKDAGPCKKLVPALREFGDKTIVTADDDAAYPHKWLESLYGACRSGDGGNHIYARNVRRILFSEEGTICPYAQWPLVQEDSASYLHMALSQGGVLYPPGCLHEDVLNEEAILRLAPGAEELFFWAMAVLRDTSVRNVPAARVSEAAAPFGPRTRCADALPADKDRQLEAIFERYNEVRLKTLIAAKVEMKSRIAAIPKAAPVQEADFVSAEYWDRRYSGGGNSGAGSYGRLSLFKAHVINDFVRTRAIRSVVEFGAGDGNQLSLYAIPEYLGVDVSPAVIRKLQERFAGDASKTFLHASRYENQKAMLGLSIDVIFHLVEDAVFETYMTNLFDASQEYVIIYSSNGESQTPTSVHVRHRRFTQWIEKNRKDWKCIQHVKNAYPIRFPGDESPDRSSCDFYIFERKDRATGRES